jgi:hypothetical protein
MRLGSQGPVARLRPREPRNKKPPSGGPSHRAVTGTALDRRPGSEDTARTEGPGPSGPPESHTIVQSQPERHRPRAGQHTVPLLPVDMGSRASSVEVQLTPAPTDSPHCGTVRLRQPLCSHTRKPATVLNAIPAIPPFLICDGASLTSTPTAVDREAEVPLDALPPHQTWPLALCTTTHSGRH